MAEKSVSLPNSYSSDFSIETKSYSLSVGAFSYGLPNLNIKSWGGHGTHISIGRYCSIAGNMTIILGGNHRMDWITTYPFGYIHNEFFDRDPSPDIIYSKGDIKIGNDVWIGENVTILSGVTVGNGAVIGAGSVVVKSVEAYRIVAGNPAREVGRSFEEETAKNLEEVAWWELGVEEVNRLIPYLQGVPSQSTIDVLKKLKKRD